MVSAKRKEKENRYWDRNKAKNHYIHTCLRCKHEWPTKRNPLEVNMCPSCKSALWNIPKRDKKGA